MHLVQIKLYKQLLFLLLAICLYSCANKEVETKTQAEYIGELRSRNIERSLIAVDSLLEKGSNQDTKAVLLFEKAKTLNDLDKTEQAVITYEEAIPLLAKAGNKRDLARGYYNLATIHISLQKKKTAINELLLALKNAKEVDFKKLQSLVYAQLANIYYSYNDYEKSLSYNQKASEIEIEIKDSANLSATYNNMGVNYKNMGDFENALVYNKKSLELNKILKDTLSVSMSYNNIGQAYKKINNTSEAVKYYLRSIELNRKNSIATSSALRNLAAYYVEVKKYAQAKKCYAEAEIIENGRDNLKSKNEVYAGLRRVAVGQNDFKRVLHYQILLDSIIEKEAAADKADDLELVEKQFKLIAAKNKLEQQKAINGKNRIILLSALGIVALLAILFFQRGKNKELKHRQEKTMLEQKVLRSQMNPHFIFNALSAIQNSMLDNSPIKSAAYLSKFAKLIRQNFDFISQKSISLTDELDALKNYIETQQLRFDQKFDYEINITDGLNEDEVSIPPLLLQPFVENAIEHGFKNLKQKGLLEINISQSDSRVVYEIKDNGLGINLDKKQDGKMHAMDVFKKRIRLMGKGLSDEIKISSSDKGTSIKFVLPL